MTHGLPPDLIADLVDPLDHGPLREASADELSHLREALGRGTARRRDGGPAPEALEGAFVTADGRAAYPVVEGVPNFLVEERIELEAPLGAG